MVPETDESARNFIRVKAVIDNTTSLKEDSWFFYNVVSSKHCPVKDPRTLMWEYSLPEFLELSEYVEIMNAIDMAVNKDQEEKIKLERMKNK